MAYIPIVKNKPNNITYIFYDLPIALILRYGFLFFSNYDKLTELKGRSLSDKPVITCINVLIIDLMIICCMIFIRSFIMKKHLSDLFQLLMEFYPKNRSKESDTNEFKKATSIIKDEIPNAIKNTSIINQDEFKITGTFGKPRLPYNPWTIIKSSNVFSHTDTYATDGEYLAYIMNERGSAVYLSFTQGTNNFTNNSSKNDLLSITQKASLIRSLLPADLINDFNSDINAIDYGSTPNNKTADPYKQATIVYKEYQFNNVPSDYELEKDLRKMMAIYEYYLQNVKQQLDEETNKPHEENDTSKDTFDIKIAVKQKSKEKDYNKANFKYDKLNSKAFSDYLASKGFSYSPDFTTNFIAALKAKPFVLLAGISGTGKTQLARKFAEYIGATERNGHYLQVPVRPDWSDSTDLFGHKTLNDGFVKGPILDFIIQANSDKKHPYILCLDEMNLARVEYYFSDFLSVIETRERDNGEITSAPLIPDLYASYKSAQKHFYASDLNIPDNIYLSDNIYIIGTVNMDESTFPFSKKVLDRAMTIEFSNVELKENLFGIDSKSNPSTINVHNDDLKARYIAPLEIEDGNRKLAQKIADELAEYNAILEEAHLHVGYRVRNEIIYYSIYAREMDPSFDYMDYALMQKVLPRIQGSSNNIRNVILNIYNKARSTSFDADDRVFEKIDADIKNTGNTKMLQTAEKIRYMLKRLQEDGYTAYWL